MKHHWPIRLLRTAFLALGLSAINLDRAAVAQTPNVLNGPIELGDGVIVDPERGIAYTMSPDRSVDAVALKDGSVTWKSKDAAKPLIAGSGRVVAQAEPGTANELAIVTLDAGKGEKVAASRTVLPAGVHVGIDHSPQGQFVASGATTMAARRSGGGQAVVTWTFNPSSNRGIRERRTASGARTRADEPVRRSGALSVDLKDGQVRAAPPSARARQDAKNSLSSVRNRLDAAETYVESISADGRHAVKATVKSKDGGDVWVWQVTDRQTGRKVGEFEQPVAYAPFYVRDGVVHVRTSEAVSGDANKPGERSALALTAIDLKSGSTQWSKPIRDTAYRGPRPP